jgi:hypothetical protein
MSAARIRIARLASPVEAKITIETRVHGDTDMDCIFVFYVRYYGNAWTTVRSEVGIGAAVSGSRFSMEQQLLALAIDESKNR